MCSSVVEKWLYALLDTGAEPSVIKVGKTDPP